MHCAQWPSGLGIQTEKLLQELGRSARPTSSSFMGPNVAHNVLQRCLAAAHLLDASTGKGAQPCANMGLEVLVWPHCPPCTARRFAGFTELGNHTRPWLAIGTQLGGLDHGCGSTPVALATSQHQSDIDAGKHSSVWKVCFIARACCARSQERRFRGHSPSSTDPALAV